MPEVKINWDRAVRMFGGPNKTFSELPERGELEELKMVKAVKASLEEEMNFLVKGPSGCGKTAFATKFVECAEVDGVPVTPVYFSGVLMSAENLKVAFPYEKDGRTALRYLIDARLRTDAPVSIILDEVGQADQEMYSAFMECLSERTIGNQKINLVNTIMMDNPSSLEYGRLNLMEFAQADRFSTINITAADSPWPRALAASFPDRDMSKVISAHNNFRFDQVSRDIANPRVLTQGVTYALVNGIPGEYGLPWMSGKRVELADPSGNTVADRDADGNERRSVTRKYIDTIADALGVSSPDRFDNPVEKAIDLVVRDGISIYMEGDPGTGKTSKVKQYLAEQYPEIAAPYFSLGNTQKEDFVIPFPATDAANPELEGSLVQMTFDFFTNPGPKVAILDEFTRGDDRTTNAANEIVQNKTVSGQAITDYIGTIAINNPPTHMGVDLDIREMTLPQASRFSLSFKIGSEETKAFEWLLSQYGDPMAPFLEWHKEAFRNPEARQGVSPRSIERLFKHWRQDLPLADALACPGGERVEAPIGDLMTMLADQPLARLGAMAKDLDSYVTKLSEKTDDGAMAHPGAHLQAYKAFTYAELSQLEKHEDVAVALIGIIAEEYRLRLVMNPDGPVQKFWHRSIKKGHEVAKKAAADS